MDSNLKRYLWSPFKFIGMRFSFISNQWGIGFCFVLFISGLLLFYFDDHIPKQIDDYLHIFFAFLGMILVLVSFVEKRNPLKAWILVILSQFNILLSVALLNDQYEYVEILLYICGLIVAAIIGTIILIKLKRKEKNLDLNDFYGHVYHYPGLGIWFLIACLAFVGLPFTPSFIGLDLMYSHIDHEEYILISFVTVSFLVLELAVLRIYARIFLGPQKTQTHPIAYRSS